MTKRCFVSACLNKQFLIQTDQEFDIVIGLCHRNCIGFVRANEMHKIQMENSSKKTAKAYDRMVDTNADM